MNSHDLHVRKMKSRNDKWGSIYIPDIPIVDPDVTVYDMAEIRNKIDSLGHLQGELEAYLDTLPGFILRSLEQD